MAKLDYARVFDGLFLFAIWIGKVISKTFYDKARRA